MNFKAALVVLGLAGFVLPQNSSDPLVDIYKPWLVDLPHDPADFNPYLGGQNWTRCCALAINESIAIVNDTLQIRPGQTVFHHNRSLLEQFPQFPCAATFNGSLIGPPQDFWTSYSWCADRCAGWSVTKPNDFDNWLRPLVSFILPSLVFCLNIPRRRTLGLPQKFFTAGQLSLHQLVLFAIKMPLAAVIVAVDLLLWLSVIFSLAGPILMSGLYEAILDMKILHFVETRIGRAGLSVRERAHLLLVVLIGNLDCELAWEPSNRFVQDLPDDSLLERFGRRRSSAATAALFQWNLNTIQGDQPVNGPGLPHQAPGVHPANYPEDQQARINRVKYKLSAMLDSQPKFAITVGAPILFYIGSFIYSVFDVNKNLGEYLTAHQLAFGMFWMTIPHISIVSSLLLAGNNPSIWQAASQQDEIPLPQHSDSYDDNGQQPRDEHGNSITSRIRNLQPLFYTPLQRAYNPSPSPIVYKSAWMWDRGCNKAEWVSRLGAKYALTESVEADILGSRMGDHLWRCLGFAIVLVFVPTFFAGMVSFTTPQTGLGCRSLLMLVYGLTQVLLMALTALRWSYLTIDNFSGRLRSIWDAGKYQLWIRISWNICYYTLASIGLFTSICGTVFILIGLFTNCLCVTRARYWMTIRTNPKAVIFWNSANQDQLYYAKTYWFPVGVAGAVFLVVIAYLGWWYQWSLLIRYHVTVGNIDQISEQTWRELEPVAVRQQSPFVSEDSGREQ